jgi:hypothetical protein
MYTTLQRVKCIAIYVCCVGLVGLTVVLPKGFGLHSKNGVFGRTRLNRDEWSASASAASVRTDRARCQVPARVGLGWGGV